jgi:hypothetical protein
MFSKDNNILLVFTHDHELDGMKFVAIELDEHLLKDLAKYAAVAIAGRGLCRDAYEFKFFASRAEFGSDLDTLIEELMLSTMLRLRAEMAEYNNERVIIRPGDRTPEFDQVLEENVESRDNRSECNMTVLRWDGYATTRAELAVQWEANPKHSAEMVVTHEVPYEWLIEQFSKVGDET